MYNGIYATGSENERHLHVINTQTIYFNYLLYLNTKGEIRKAFINSLPV